MQTIGPGEYNSYWTEDATLTNVECFQASAEVMIYCSASAK